MKKLARVFIKVNQVLNIVYAVAFFLGALIFALTLPAMQAAAESGSYASEAEETAVNLVVSGVWGLLIAVFFIIAVLYLVGAIISSSASKKLATATKKRELISYGILLLLFGAFPAAGIVLFVIPDRQLESNQEI